jgi:hypothetical protein
LVSAIEVTITSLSDPLSDDYLRTRPRKQAVTMGLNHYSQVRTSTPVFPTMTATRSKLPRFVEDVARKVCYLVPLRTIHMASWD